MEKKENSVKFYGENVVRFLYIRLKKKGKPEKEVTPKHMLGRKGYFSTT